jgi:hypothetical protein
MVKVRSAGLAFALSALFAAAFAIPLQASATGMPEMCSPTITANELLESVGNRLGALHFACVRETR